MNFQSIGHSKQKTSWASEKWAALKKKILPSSIQERKKRLGQYRDIGVFIISIGLVTLLEGRLQKILKVDKSELQQFSNMQSSMHQAY